MPAIQFKYTILYVHSVAETLEFYQRAFQLETAFLHESGDYGELNTGNTKLAFSSQALMQELNKTPGKPLADAPCFEIAFEVDDVAAALSQALAAGANLIQGVEYMPWGQTTAYINDNNGFTIELCSAVDN